MGTPAWPLVYDRSPLTRLALMTVLRRADVACTEFGDPDLLLATCCDYSKSVADGRPIVIASVSVADDIAVVERISDLDGIGVIAVHADGTPEIAAELLHAGATSVVQHADVEQQLLAALAAAGRGYGMIPAEVVRWVSARADPNQFLSKDEVDWIRRLQQGHTITRLAADIGYSERNMYRLLHGLYGRLGVANREQAIDAARRRGLL